ncbi:Uncharacterised protein [uncultured archaeon]|nr:Uncharacterised protein [uncultured archaeon]
MVDIIFPNGRRLSEFALSGSGGLISGTLNMNNYPIINVGGMVPNADATQFLGSGSRRWAGIDTIWIDIGDENTYIYNTSGGNMTFQVAAGKKFTFVVG